jgi:predicted transcriptional regulator YheO
MGKVKVSVSEADKLIVEGYKLTIDALAAYLGDAFELVLHDLNDLDHSVVKIVNGFHSGRKEGAPITDLALAMLERINKDAAEGYITYYSKSKYGKPVKSSTTAIFGERHRVIGLLCINLYLDSPITSLLHSFSTEPPGEFVSENFITRTDELILRVLERIKTEVQRDISIPASRKNREIIILLYHQGIFKLKDAVKIVSRELRLSKNTVYMHIRALENSEGRAGY